VEAIPKTETPEPTVEVNPADVVDVEELTPEQLKELVEADGASENPGAFVGLLCDVLAIGVGFIAFDYVNIQILNALASNGISMTQTNLLLASAGLLLGEIVLAFLLIHKVKGKVRGLGAFVEPFAYGMLAAGVRTLYVAALNYTTPLGLPAVTTGVGRALVPSNRVVGT
jgi:hypothetical protein